MAKQEAYKSLLDYWSPPEVQEDEQRDSNVVPIAFITTTYSYDSDFFEDECMSRFLAMDTERENDGVAYLIEREEKLAGLHGGIVMVDQNNCKGKRSIRWDLISCRVPNGVMHAKITLLHWSNCVRLIISSANLTPNGYCINQEIYGVIDYSLNGDADLKLINEVLFYLQLLVEEQGGEVIKGRFAKLQAEIKASLQKWNIAERQYKRDEVSVHTLFVSPKERDAFRRLKNIWGGYTSSPPNAVFITSPFFDSDKTPNTPSLKIFEVLRQRGSVYVHYNVLAEPIDEKGKELLVHAPEFLKETPDSSSTKFLEFKRVTEQGLNEEGKSVPRPLHMKSIWLCNDDMNLYQIGSSNFTSPGLGLGSRVNYEANLVYCVSESRNGKAYRFLDERYLSVDDLDTDLLKFRQRENEDELAEGSEYIYLPLCFGEAVLQKIEAKYVLELTFLQSTLPQDFEIHVPIDKSEANNTTCIYNQKQWILDIRKMKIKVEWEHTSIPDHLIVSWKDANGKAYWPVIVDSQISLPPVEPLRDLPLEALIQILSSTQPLYRLLNIIEKAKSKKNNGVDETINLDALQLVDSSGFLLQRTRRVSYAMRALREHLQKPVYTSESLNWRLYGPIGVNSLKEAILKEAKSENEKVFLLAELALELSRVKPTETNVSIKAEEVKTAIKKLLEELSTDFLTTGAESESPITYYSTQAFQKAINGI